MGESVISHMLRNVRRLYVGTRLRTIPLAMTIKNDLHAFKHDYGAPPAASALNSPTKVCEGHV